MCPSLNEQLYCYSIVWSYHNKAFLFSSSVRAALSPPKSNCFAVNNIRPSILLWQLSCRAAKTNHSSLVWGLYVSIWKRHWNKQVIGAAGGSLSLEMPPRPGGVCDRPSPGELASMMNDHLSTLYRPTKSCAYHAFMTNFCCFVWLPPIFWMKLQKAAASFLYCTSY